MLIIILAGAFGGYVSALFDNMKTQTAPYKNDDCSKCNGRYYHCRAMVGICGAFGVVLIGGWMGKVSLALSLEKIIELISMCVISGVVSYRLLPVIGQKLQKQIDALEAQAQSNNTTIQAIQETSHNDIQRESMIQDALTMARDMLSSPKASNSDIYTAISLMENVKGSSAAKFQRSFHVYLGRLYRRVKNYDAAINILRGYINTLDTDSQMPAELVGLAKPNKAVALYNIACYHALKAVEVKSTSTEPEVIRLIEEALKELDASLALDPQNWPQVTGPDETDFDIIKNNAEWNQKLCDILETAKGKTGGNT